MNASPHHLSRDQVIALLEERDTLREHVRQLEEALAPTLILPRAWGLTTIESQVLSALRAASPHVAHHERLMLAVWGMWDDVPGPNTLKVHVCRVRRKLMQAQTRIAVETVWGRGWRLEAESCARFDALVHADRARWPNPTQAAA